VTMKKRVCIYEEQDVWMDGKSYMHWTAFGTIPLGREENGDLDRTNTKSKEMN
jgi:hypothetical protein